MDIANLLSKLAAKAGQELPQDVLNAASAVQFNVPDEIAGKMFENVLSINEARNSKDVKSHYFKQFADGVEAELNKGKALLGDEAFTEVMQADTLFKKVSTFAAKAGEVIETAKAGAANPEEVKKYIDQVNQLNKAIKDKENQFNETLQSVHRDYEGKFVDKELTSKLVGFKFNEAIPEEYRLKLAKEAVYDGLKTSGAAVVLKDGNLKLVQSQDQNLEFTGGKLEDIVQKSLVEKKLIQLGAASAPARHTPPASPASGSHATGNRLSPSFLETVAKIKEGMGTATQN